MYVYYNSRLFAFTLPIGKLLRCHYPSIFLQRCRAGTEAEAPQAQNFAAKSRQDPQTRILSAPRIAESSEGYRTCLISAFTFSATLVGSGA